VAVGAGRSARPAPAGFDNEPDTDFSLAQNRRWIDGSLRRWQERPITDVPVVVDGAAVRGLPIAASTDPSNPSEPSYRWAQCDVATVDRAVAAALGAADHPPTTAERRGWLHAVADVMAARRGETIAAMVHDAGKTVSEADAEVSEAIDFARWYADSTALLEALAGDGLVFEPHGPVVVASPWNFPYAIAAGGVLAALAAGSPVLLKPAPETVLTSWLLAQHCWEAGVPTDMVQFTACADDEAGQTLVSHPDVGLVILTGAYETAELFESWRPGLRVHAETSGKNAIVVTEAADLDAAVRDIVRSAFGHAGQKCSAASLVIAEGPVYEDERFRRQLHDAVTSLRVGRADDLATVLGPLIHPPSGALADALTKLEPGEEWLVAPAMVDGNPHLWSPGVKLGVQPNSTFHLTECFGPVLGLMRADDLDHAVSLQNGTGFGLTGGIHSLDENEVARWSDAVEVGNAYVNRSITGAIVRRQPFGGWKRSAVGPGAKAGGPNYVASLGVWRHADPAVAVRLDRAAVEAGFRQCWRTHFGVEHDPSGLAAESNVFRYRPLRRVHVRLAGPEHVWSVGVAQAAARVAGVEVSCSAPVPVQGCEHLDNEALAGRLGSMGLDKVRVLGDVPAVLRQAAAACAIPVDDAPVVAEGRIELLRWVREQSVSRTRHRYGNIVFEEPRQ
jgi:RHH-type proline utilization regulon transcriptional repressor/proline dehydrogenase/delta 1-pyrroline-5-carboxylate dehydrogenase